MAGRKNMSNLIDAAKRFKQKHDERPIREGGLFPKSERLIEALESLRDRVDNYNQFPTIILSQNSVFQEMKPTDFRYIQIDGFKFGYSMRFVTLLGSDYMLRRVIVTVENWDLGDLSKRERMEMNGAIYHVFIIPGGEKPGTLDLDISTMLIYQFIPIMFQHEKSPNIVTPGQDYFKSLRKKDGWPKN